jgi:1-phosphofructokinase family hexose kinase
MDSYKPDILCVSPTPALDHYVTVKSFKIGKINRSIQVIERAGGKSINGARAIQLMGGYPLVISVLGGLRGNAIIEYAKREGIALLSVPIEDETRLYTEVWDETDQISTHISEQWSKVTPKEWALFIDLISQQIKLNPNLKTSVVSGGIPPGIGYEEMTNLVKTISGAGIPCFVDSEGDTLEYLLAAKPTVVKINHLEASNYLGEFVESIEDAVKACGAFISRGIEACVITMGDKGAIGAKGNEIFHVNIDQKGLWPVGSGDSFLAAMAVKWTQGKSWLDILIAGAAAGTANAHRRISGNLDMEIYELGLKSAQFKKLEHSASDK